MENVAGNGHHPSVSQREIRNQRMRDWVGKVHGERDTVRSVMSMRRIR